MSSVSVSCATTTLTVLGQQTQCSAVAVMSNATSQDQTTASQWSSGNASIATVSPTGVLTATGQGSVTITATFQGTFGTRAVTVTAPRSFTLQGTVTDGTSHGVLPKINIQITSGANAGKSAVTDAAGNYTIPDLTEGTFTLSASATSYETATQDVTITANQRLDLVLKRVPGPPAAPLGSLIVILDDKTCSGKIQTATVAVDGAVVGGVAPGTAITGPVTAGSHLVTASSTRYSWSITVSVPSTGTSVLLTCPAT